MVKHWKALNILAEVWETEKIIAFFLNTGGFLRPPKEIYEKRETVIYLKIYKQFNISDTQTVGNGYACVYPYNSFTPLRNLEF